MAQNLKGNKIFANRMQNGPRVSQNNGGKVRLRRIGNKQALIQQNLSHMEQQAHKKRLAQDFYYNNSAGRSPLTRLPVQSKSDQKPSVQDRLGLKIRLQRNINQKAVQQKRSPQQKIRLQRKRPQQGQRIQRTQRNDRMVVMQNVQNRLTRIRQGNVMQQKNNKQRGIVQKGAIQRAFMQRGLIQPGLASSAGQKVRLRRTRPQQNVGAVNYTVQVANNNARIRNTVKHHMSTELNPTLQEEIRIIQRQKISQDVIPALPLHPTGMGVTGRSLHERFSQL